MLMWNSSNKGRKKRTRGNPTKMSAVQFSSQDATNICLLSQWSHVTIGPDFSEALWHAISLLLYTSLERISSSCCDGIISYRTFGSQIILFMIVVRGNQEAFMCSYAMPMMSHEDYFTPPILLGLFVCKEFSKKKLQQTSKEYIFGSIFVAFWVGRISSLLVSTLNICTFEYWSLGLDWQTSYFWNQFHKY